jgi:hypothetical protein
MLSVKPGRRKIVIWIVVGVAIVAGFAHMKGPERREPVYHGRTLTQWLKRSLPSPTARQIEAAEAIREMGAEVLALLMRDIHVTPPQDAFRFRAERSINRALERMFDTRIGFADVTEDDRIRWRAAQGLAALGPLAKPAVPSLSDFC